MSICWCLCHLLKDQFPNDWPDSISYGCLYEGHYARHQVQKFKYDYSRGLRGSIARPNELSVQDIIHA